MKSKKALILLVEGPSDETALHPLFKSFCKPDEVVVLTLHTDITSQSGIDTRNIVSELWCRIKSFIDINGIRHNSENGGDILEIVHITDTDGAYADDSKIAEDPSISGAIYTSFKIRTSNKKNISERNKQKSRNLDVLSSKDKIAGVPYRIFYMSCNLDHVLHNKQNSSEREKKKNSFDIAIRYQNDHPAYVSYLSDSEFSVTGDYLSSWKFIKEGLHSLERHTNIGICFNSKN